MIRLHRVSKSFGETAVLCEFSLDLPERGAIAFMGPSGCGKTTLLRLLCGLEKPDSGEVNLPQDARISVVFQEDRLLEGFSVRENIMAVLPRANGDLADTCIERCGLADVATQKPPSLSGGMRRRVSLARAMAYDGEILLLDEPFKGLDDETRRLVASFVFEGSASRLTVLVTHDAKEAEEYCDKIYRFTGVPLALQEEY